MKRSTHRILTTHTGSLPRPADLVEMLRKADTGEAIDAAAFAARVKSAVAETVQKQVEAGIDIVNDGEMGKPGYSTYVKDRLTGFEGASRVLTAQGEAADFPEWNQRRLGGPQAQFSRPTCTGPIAWKDFEAVKRDIDNLKAATSSAHVEEVFLSAASPGVIAIFLGNEYFPSQEAYLAALVDVMKEEYEAITNAGFTLQLDCPDLAMSRHNRYSQLPTSDFRKIVEMHVEAVNAATRNIPSDRIRLHLCWGNYEGPHHLDVPLQDILDIVFRANADAISFEGANPRHEWEWKVWGEVKVPDEKIVMPGVIDSTTNFIEHPELVAQRITNYAGVVGRERVVAGTDCGFGTFAVSNTVDPKIAWAKLASLAEGARLASKALW
jgi:5-methyltetrahydropteroyltriglutamate--homocysteine methyltransferase